VDRIEALARVLWEDGIERDARPVWDDLLDCDEALKEEFRSMARAALRQLGFVNAKGEVYCPSEDAVRQAVEALERYCKLCMGPCGDREHSECEVGFTLRVLRGEE